MALRNLLINMGFQFDDSQLRDADEQTDLLVNKFEYGNTAAMEMGEGVAESSDMMSNSLYDTADASTDTANSVTDIGDSAQDTADVGTGAFSSLNDSLGELGSTANMVLGAIGTGLSAMVLKSASDLEAARHRLRWFTSESEGDYEKIQDAIQRTVDTTHGLYAEGGLAEASIQVLKLGADVDFVAEHMEAMAVLSVKHGEDISDVMRQVARAVEIGSVRQLQEMGIVTEEHFNMLGREITQSIRNWDKYSRQQLLTVALQDVMNEELDQFNEYTETTDNQLDRIYTQLGNIMEIMGLPLLSIAADSLEKFTDNLIELQSTEAGKTFLSIAGGIIAVVGGLAAIGAAYNGLAWALAPMIGAISAPVLAFMGILVFSLLVIQDVIYYLKGMDSWLGTIEDRFGNWSYLVSPILIVIDALKTAYNISMKLVDVISDFGDWLGFGESDVNIGTKETLSKDVNIPKDLQSIRESRINNDNKFNADVSINVTGNGDPNRISQDVVTTLRRNFDSMIDEYNRKLARQI
jgi:hypothetical protein